MRKITLEGIMVPFGAADKDGDEFISGCVDCERFIEEGYMTSRCDVSPSLGEIIGEPIRVDELEDGVHLEAMIHNEYVIDLFEAGLEFGFATAGRIKKREADDVNGRGKILDCEISHVAVVPADKLTDPRCRCRLQYPKEFWFRFNGPMEVGRAVKGLDGRAVGVVIACEKDEDGTFKVTTKVDEDTFEKIKQGAKMGALMSAVMEERSEDHE